MPLFLSGLVVVVSALLFYANLREQRPSAGISMMTVALFGIGVLRFIEFLNR